jgi:hypothetical protein
VRGQKAWCNVKVKEQIDREMLRKALLKFLAERFRLAFVPMQIVSLMTRRGMVDFEFDAEDIEQSLLILKGLGLVDDVLDELGATRYSKITAKGIIENERLNQ